MGFSVTRTRPRWRWIFRPRIECPLCHRRVREFGDESYGNRLVCDHPSCQARAARYRRVVMGFYHAWEIPNLGVEFGLVGNGKCQRCRYWTMDGATVEWECRGSFPPSGPDYTTMGQFIEAIDAGALIPIREGIENMSEHERVMRNAKGAENVWPRTQQQ